MGIDVGGMDAGSTEGRSKSAGYVDGDAGGATDGGADIAGGATDGGGGGITAGGSEAGSGWETAAAG